MWFGDEAEAGRLETLGHEQLEAGDGAAALKTADRLIAMGWSGGFVVEALAHRSAGRLDVAVERLEVAVERVPAAWELWHLLGNLRSDRDDVDAALEAFERALACEGASRIAIHFNRAIAYRRAGRFGEALADLDPILALPKPPLEIAESALALTLECLAGIGRAEDAVDMIEAALERCAADDPRRPVLDAEHALALDRARADRAKIEAAFAGAVDAGVASPALIALGRRLFPASAEGAQHRLQLVVQGEAPAGSGAAGFLRVFDVVAVDPERALELARRYLPSHARATVQIERADVREPDVELEPGVHAASELMFFA
ncbi:MAG: tetratricopeptide repeat protein [Sandaracinaceae bacterium]|nr:tetratricopeptide repeat protein [Sandaracinaceae bacterium]